MQYDKCHRDKCGHLREQGVGRDRLAGECFIEVNAKDLKFLGFARSRGPKDYREEYV